MTYASVAETFRDKTVLITGGTGFLGKLLTEKLLRSCPVAAVAVLVRSKKGIAAGQRVAETYGQPLFDRLRRENPDFMNHIKIIEGNVENPSLAMSSSDREWIIENVNLVFHCAATIKFNETIELATKINIEGTERLLELAAEMKHLEGFVHVSTAYSHCWRDEIKEQYYPVSINTEALYSIDETSAKILKNWPNTYTFTKAIAENLVSTNTNNLPVSIFRPSIIGCTVSEPDPGWVLNINGPSGVVTPVIVGFLRTLPMATDKIADIIPADYTVNALISVMWDTVNRCQDLNQIGEKPTIYNYISSAESPITWGRFITQIVNTYNEAPPLQSLWYIFYIFYTNLRIGYVLKFCFHRIPAALMDLSLILTRKKPKMLKMYAKTEQVMELLGEFTTKQWKFDNRNTRHLWSSMSQEDRKTFPFSLDKFDWTSYNSIYYMGIREHILREDLSNIEKALSKNRKLLWLHQTCIALTVFLIFQILWVFIRYSD